MKEIFISYSVMDAAAAQTLLEALESNGLSCWIAPRDIPGGSNYTKQIPVAIRKCEIFLLVLSPNAQKSPWVLKELDAAVNAGKVILPFMLADFRLGDEFNFLLTGAQRFAAYEDKAAATQSLILRIRELLQLEPAPIPQPAELPQEGPLCIACGSSELTPLPKKMIRQGRAELLTLLLIPAMALVGAVLGQVLAWMIGAFFTDIFLWMLLGLVLGGIYGGWLSRTICRRRQIRSHVKATCYRCKTCSKVFRHNAPFTF